MQMCKYIYKNRALILQFARMKSDECEFGIKSCWHEYSVE